MSIRHHIAAVLIGLGGALLAASPWGLAIEENLGLGFLFDLRGPRAAPTEVVVVNIDRHSATALDVPDEPERWPRHLHADLVRKLSEAGVALVAFNIFFGSSQSVHDDAELAEALRQAGNVVLTSYLKPRQIHDTLYAESVLQPLPLLADAALATAPFLLPRESHVVRQFLTFDSTGAEPLTLPATLLHLHVLRHARHDLISTLRVSHPSLADYLERHPVDYLRRHHFQSLKTVLTNGLPAEGTHPSISGSDDIKLPPSGQNRALLKALFDLYAQRMPRYFNHYGPSGTVATVPYHEVLARSENYRQLLQNKVVFVGFSWDLQPESTEGAFFSVYSPISSVELAATAFSNLLENRTIHPPVPVEQFFGLFLWGYLISLIAQGSSLLLSSLGFVCSAVAYLLLSHGLFAHRGIWLPLVTPLVIQGGASLLTAWADRYRQYSRDRRQMQAVVERFVPVEVISRFVEHHPEDDISDYSRLSFGICLATDAGRYTSLAESMDPMVLGDLMNEYWGAMFPPIRSAGGWISDVIGDAMLAIWTAPTDQPEVRRKALNASLTLLNVASEFERSHQIELPIRVGLHSGEMRIGYVGSAERGEYRAVGDTVNTAARIEALNKLLGTRVLATQMVVTGLESCFSLRRLGNFQLAGKNQLVTVYELMDTDSPETKPLIARFAGALDLFDAGRWQPALTAFSGLLEELPNDGPSQFYLRLCRDFLADPVVQRNHRIIKTRKTDDSRRIWTPPVD